MMHLKQVELNKRFFPDLNWKREHDNTPDAIRSPECAAHIAWASTVINGVRGQTTRYRYDKLQKFLTLRYTLYYFDKVSPATYIDTLLSYVE